MNRKRILIVEDEPTLAMSLADLLGSEQYDTQHAGDGRSALAMVHADTFDLMVLDLMLPEMSGWDVCRTLRSEGSTLPVLMLTARGGVTDRVTGLRLGADDYLPKPFDEAELLARVEALLRRAGNRSEAPRRLHLGAAVVDMDAAAIERNGQSYNLSAREFELLRYLVMRTGTLISRETLLREVWGYPENLETRTVDVHIATLRNKIEADPARPRHVLTVRGLGYRLVV